MIMEEQIKLESLKDVLVELQKLQLKYFGKCAFHINTFRKNIEVLIPEIYDCGFFNFSVFDNCVAWRVVYERILEYLKRV